MVELSSDEDFKTWFLKESDFDKNTALHLAVMHKVDYLYNDQHYLPFLIYLRKQKLSIIFLILINAILRSETVLDKMWFVLQQR